MIRRTKNGSYKSNRFEVFLNVREWRLGSYKIGTMRVLQLGPTRIFIREKS